MERIDELRRLLDLHDREIVVMTQLEGLASIPDPDTHGMSMKYVRTGDRALIFVGPSDQLDGTLTYNDDDTTTVSFTFPTKPGQGDVVSGQDARSAAQDQGDPLAGLPDDLARVLRDQSIIVPQDAAVFELVAKWMDAPSDTASALTVEEWSKAWGVTCGRMLDAQHENERLREALDTISRMTPIADPEVHEIAKEALRRV